MGRKDASTIKLPVDQYRKQIGKQDYKKTKPILRATKLKAEAKKTAIGIKVPVFCFYCLRRIKAIENDVNR
uniref:Triple QxxK/R motif-containing protein n=1 Tax=Capra hircus TaxID=9925 RepID=A0A452DXL1_CAPHI